MLADPRAEALATRFAAQWLRLPDLEALHPDVRVYPDFDEQLKWAMQRETELFFLNLVREDRSVLELLDADYTFVNERLAKHYGIPGVVGPDFRRVTFPAGEVRRGLLGHGSVLALTSYADRTSPGAPWQVGHGGAAARQARRRPPPPDVPDLEETVGCRGRTASPGARAAGAAPRKPGVRLVSSHDGPDRGSPWSTTTSPGPCASRTTARSSTPRASCTTARRSVAPPTCGAALLERPAPIVRTFVENLMAYALGRRIEHHDMPFVREVANVAANADNRLSAFILGVVRTPAFRMKGGLGEESIP